MKLDVTDGRITVEAADLAPLLDLDPGEMRRRMHAGEISILSEAGTGDDEGRFRVTFRANRWQVRLTCSSDGTVLKRLRARVGA